MSLALEAFRTYYQVSGWIAPEATARRAADLFLTPTPRAAPTRWPAPLDASARASTHRFQGEDLAVWTFGDGPAVLLSHGWGGCAGQLARLIPPLVAAGASVVAFDGPAHGASKAKRTNLLEFSSVILELAEKHGAVAASGHSFGSASLIYALHRGLSVERVALFAPFSSSDKNIQRYADFLKMTPRVHARTREHLLEFFKDAMPGWHLAKLSASLHTPALILHDRQDEEIPYEESAEIAATWPGARLLSTEGLGHRKILKDEPTLAEATRFLMGR